MEDSKKKPNSKSQIPPSRSPLLVIVGPTASGKSDLAMKIAKLQNGEIICADSRTVYRRLNIGTAKPSDADRAEVPHHLLDVVNPDENFTVADFKELAETAIKDVQKRGKLPIMVGGSGLYIDSVLFDYKFSEAGVAKDPSNPRHVLSDSVGLKSEMRGDAIVVGLQIDRVDLKERIASRIDAMLDDGFLDEVKNLQAMYPTSKALLSTGYKAFSEYVKGHISLEEAKALFIKNDHNLAKRQMTWFKRNKRIHWLNTQSTYIKDTQKLLNKLH